MQKAAQLRLMEKEKNKSPSCAMRISTRINKVVWSMLADGKSFAEAEINDMVNLISFQPNIFLSVIFYRTRTPGVLLLRLLLENDDHQFLQKTNSPSKLRSCSDFPIDMQIFDFDRDYKDIGIAQLTTKLFVLKNGLANAKSDTVLAPWNPPSEWGK